MSNNVEESKREYRVARGIWVHNKIEPVAVCILKSFGWKDEYHRISEHGDMEQSDHYQFHSVTRIPRDENMIADIGTSEANMALDMLKMTMDEIVFFDEYDALVEELVINPENCNNLQYASLGLAEEVGEVISYVKRGIRDHDGNIPDAARESVKKELGDVLWYLSRFCKLYGTSLSEIASINIKKLQSRKERNAIGGKGNER